jgi:hypothetical protein
MQATWRQPATVAEIGRIMSLCDGDIVLPALRAHQAPTPGVEPPDGNEPIPPEVPQPDPAPQQDPIPHQDPI